MANSFSQLTDSAQSFTVINVDTAMTIDRDDCPALVVNTAAGGTLLVTLPQDAKAGDVVSMYVTAAQTLRLTPGAAGAVYILTAKQTDNKYIEGNAVGDFATLVADGNGDWVAIAHNSITVES